MQTNEQKALILSLIRDDLINRKLVDGLRNLGMDADMYMLHLSSTIFGLLQVQDSFEGDKLFAKYERLSAKATAIDIHTSHQPLDALALEIYTYLMTHRQKLPNK